MKKQLIVCLLILALCLGGCAIEKTPGPGTASEPTVPTPSVPVGTETKDTDEDLNSPTREAPSTEAPTAETPTESAAEPRNPESERSELADNFQENPAFTRIAGPNCDPSILAVIYNEPFVNGEAATSALWVDGEYDRLVLCPRYVGSMIDVWRISHSEDGGEETTLEGPVYYAVCEEEDCYGAALERPEGEAKWAVSVTVPEYAYACLELNYNGRYGTPAYEYLTDQSAVINAAAQTMDPLIAKDLAESFGEDPFYAFLRTALRSRKDPWAAMQQYCSPLGDYGDAAAYTVCQGEMEGDTYYLEAARLRESYDPGEGSPAERAEAQAKRFAEIGNRDGILGVDASRTETPYFELLGLTVYNPTLRAAEVSVRVNGQDAGTYPLTEGDFVTLLDVKAERIPADTAIRIEITVTDSRGDPNAALLEVWPGIGGNISGAR